MAFVPIFLKKIVKIQVFFYYEKYFPKFFKIIFKNFEIYNLRKISIPKFIIYEKYLFQKF